MNNVNKAIVYTRHDGGVSICRPTQEVIQAMSHGGYWNDRPHGFAERQIENHIKGGIHPDHAKRYVNAMTFGGCTTAEAYDIIKDRDCGRLGILHELHDEEDIPQDRWFRNAWYRSSNGGPIGIHLDKAKPIQWQYVKNAIDRETVAREKSFEDLPKLDISIFTLKNAIRHAKDIEELRRIWPEGLPVL